MQSEDEVNQLATVYEAESFYSTLRTKCWDTCIHANFDMETAVAATYKKGRDRILPYDACLRRCRGRMNSSHDEISEDFMKQIEQMAQKQKEMEAMQQGGNPGMM
eukprot:TRINITY_DN1802_c6_g1_i2.p1 TRINITY_DN1802_c6_g1~~TRINITY_DN1802_c6_g1_i2.p1  ORF type:complete len:105 (+),score=16.16 TRINITY_DN1802_c6_g1_i2:103-417(+)